MQSNAKQCKATQCKAMLSNTKQCKAKHSNRKATHSKTEQSKAMQSNTRPGKEKQSNAKQWMSAEMRLMSPRRKKEIPNWGRAGFMHPSRASPLPYLGKNKFSRIFPQLGLPIRGSNCVPKQPVSGCAAGPPRVPWGRLIWPGSSRNQSLVPQPPNVPNVQNVWQNPQFFFRARRTLNFFPRCARSQMSNMLNVKCQEC